MPWPAGTMGGSDLPERPVLAQHGLPSVTVDRLVRCHRLCVRLNAEGQEYTSSQEIGDRLGYSPSQARKDFSRLGRLGTRGSGYRVGELQKALGRVLGKGRSWNVALVGAGNLGSALLTYGGFERQGFRFVAVFDADPEKVGLVLGGLVVEDVSAVPESLRTLDVEIGMIAVPATGAQWVASLLAENGVGAILNFAPATRRSGRLRGADDATLWPGQPVVVSNVDLAIELEKLCYYLMAPVGPSPRRHAAQAPALREGLGTPRRGSVPAGRPRRRVHDVDRTTRGEVAVVRNGAREQPCGCLRRSETSSEFTVSQLRRRAPQRDIRPDARLQYLSPRGGDGCGGQRLQLVSPPAGRSLLRAGRGRRQSPAGEDGRGQSGRDRRKGDLRVMPRGGDNVVDPTAPRGGDNVVDPTAPRGGDIVVDPTAPQRNCEAHSREGDSREKAGT